MDRLLTAHSRIFVVMLSSHQKSLRPAMCVPVPRALTQWQVWLKGEVTGERRAIYRQCL